MTLAVLSEEDVRQLLENLSHDEAEALADTLRCALHEYSTGTQLIDAGLIHQPERTLVHSNATGATTLFMPSCSPVGHGVKGKSSACVSSPSADPSLPTIRPTGSVSLYGPDGNPIGFLHAQTLTAFRTALGSTCLLMKRANVRTLTVFGSGLQAYWHIRLALMLRGHTIRSVNIINRRFSDNAKLILKKFYAVPTEAKQREGWEAARFSVLTPGYGEYSRLQKDHIRDADVIYCCTPSTEDLFDASILTNHEGRKKGRLIVAVGSYTKNMRELPKELLLQATKVHSGSHFHYHKHALEGGVVIVDTLDGALKESGEIVDAGLEANQLVELGELVMIDKLARGEEDSLVSLPSTEVSSIADSFDKLDITSTGSAMSTVFGSSDSSPSVGRTSTGDSNTAHDKRSSSPSPHRRRQSVGFSLPFHHRRTPSQQSNSDKQQQQKQRDDHLARWLTSGNVIYKSVGLGLMDLVVGLEVVRLAREKHVGCHIENFS
ncbi:UbiD family decarboxylase [Biscogniauxia sp. FL1348]|nr:UbiD family decarboxylase [Biscogniauxia sp. FL1348]